MKRYLILGLLFFAGGVSWADSSLNQLTKVSTMTATDLLYKMESPGSGNLDRSIAFSDLQTNIGINPSVADSDGATVTFDLSQGTFHKVTLGGNRTLALSNPSVGQNFTLVLTQDGTGNRTVTWFSGILWPAGIVPTLTTTPSKTDIFTFRCPSAGVYYGFVNGQNF